MNKFDKVIDILQTITMMLLMFFIVMFSYMIIDLMRASKYDVNHDGVVNSIDASLVTQCYLGYIDCDK